MRPRRSRSFASMPTVSVEHLRLANALCLFAEEAKTPEEV
jgi:hypothetical protein